MDGTEFQTKRLPKFPCVTACCGGEKSGSSTQIRNARERRDRPAMLTKIRLNARGDREVPRRASSDSDCASLLERYFYYLRIGLDVGFEFHEIGVNEAGKDVEEILARVIDITVSSRRRVSTIFRPESKYLEIAP